MDWRSWLLPVALVACVIVMIVPMPPAVIDVLLVANIALSIIILLTTLNVQTPIEFSLFPAVLLTATMSRLVLNISTTRLILTDGHKGADAAGGIIQSFGSFVVGEQLIVGLIIFSIIAVVQFVVVTKGATRVSEVAARFALDGMPGRQMAIDADLSAGIIDQVEANLRRENLTLQADFYGAMDGASKFVRGDAIAGVLITFINIVGGLAMGISHGMSLSAAGETFTRLTIGDGLASQIPAFIIAIATGILMTRNSQKTNLPVVFWKQLFGRPAVLTMAAVFLALLVFTHLPTVPLLTIAAICIALVWLQRREASNANDEPQNETATSSATNDEHDRRLEELLRVDPLEMEIGVDLVALADTNLGGDLLRRIVVVRQETTATMGVILPKVRIRDNLRIGKNEFRIKINNVVVASGTVFPDRLLATGDPNDRTTATIAGVPANPFDPALGAWIEPGRLAQAQAAGMRCRPAAEVLADELKKTALRHADQLLTRDATRFLIDQVRKTSPAVVDELLPNLLKLSDVQQVLQALLREKISIRRLAVILEALGDYAGRTTDIIWLAEFVRQRLAPGICQKHCDENNVLHAARLPADVEQVVAESFEHRDGQLRSNLTSTQTEQIAGEFRAALAPLVQQGYEPVLLVGQKIRPSIQQLSYATIPDLVVLSPNDLTPDVKVEFVPAARAA